MSARNKWPYPGDSNVARARKIAGAYRALAVEQRDLLDRCVKVLAAVDKRLIAFSDATVLAGIDKLVNDTVELTAPADLDTRFREWGEDWHADIPIHYEADDWVTSKEAAPIAGIAKESLGQLRIRGRIKGQWDKSLGGRGGWRYRVGDLWDLAARKRTRNTGKTPTPTDSITDDGTGDPE